MVGINGVFMNRLPHPFHKRGERRHGLEERCPEQTAFSLSPASSSAFEREAPPAHILEGLNCGDLHEGKNTVPDSYCVFRIHFKRMIVFSGYQEPSVMAFCKIADTSTSTVEVVGVSE